MPDPGSSLRAMILRQSEFDLVAVRVRCMQIAVLIGDLGQAAEVQQLVVDAVSRLELALALEAAGIIDADMRQRALDAVAALERAAYG